MHLISCQQCGEATPAYDIVNYGSGEGTYRELCNACVNQDAARRMGVPGFQHARFDPVEVVDARGLAHTFHFRVRCFHNLAIDAFELVDGAPGGYQFQLIDHIRADPWAMLARLVERIRQALRLTHLDEVDGVPAISDRVVRGRIESDLESDDGMPVLVIDGRELSWDAFGRMLMAFEGWQFKLECFDPSEAV